MPNSLVDVFNSRISDKMNVLQRVRKLCYLLGDLNIDSLKAGDRRVTGELLDVLYFCNVFPLIILSYKYDSDLNRSYTDK